MRLSIGGGGNQSIALVGTTTQDVRYDVRYPLNGDPDLAVICYQAPRGNGFRTGVTVLIQRRKSPGGKKWTTVQSARIDTSSGDRLITLDPRLPLDPVNDFVREHLLPHFADSPSRPVIITHDEPNWIWVEEWKTPQVFMASDGDTGETNGPRTYRDTIDGERVVEHCPLVRDFCVTRATWAIEFYEHGDTQKFARMHVGPGCWDHLDEITEVLSGLSLG